MQRLGGLDAAFLAAETHASPMHIGWLCVCERSEEAPVHERVRRHLEPRLGLVPALRRRLVEVPAGLHRPVLVEDPTFSLEDHLRSVVLPRPGWQALERFVASEMATPLERDRPLWDLVVVEGLDDEPSSATGSASAPPSPTGRAHATADHGATGAARGPARRRARAGRGRYAVLARIHHALADGVAGLRFAAALLETSPGAPPPPPAAFAPEHLPGAKELLAAALGELARWPEEALSRLDDLRRALAWLVPGPDGADRPQAVPRPFGAPRTGFNKALTPSRAIACAAVPLALARAIAGRARATVNDVVLAACASAVRTVLLEHGELPEQDLVAMVPVSLRGDDGADHGGNRISAMLVTLPTTEPDPARRLAATADAARAAKAASTRAGSGWLPSAAELLPPALVAGLARIAGASRLFDRIPPIANLIVSNVVGPTAPLWLASDPLVAAYPLGPLPEGIGLNITVLSYTGTLWFGLVTCPDLLPDPSHLAALLTEAFGELACATDRGRRGRQRRAHAAAPRARRASPC